MVIHFLQRLEDYWSRLTGLFLATGDVALVLATFPDITPSSEKITIETIEVLMVMTARVNRYTLSL